METSKLVASTTYHLLRKAAPVLLASLGTYVVTTYPHLHTAFCGV